MKSARWCAVASILAAMLDLTWWIRGYAQRRDGPRFVDAPARPEDPRDAPLREIEDRLRPIAEPKRRPGPHDWLANHFEGGQTFADYRAAGPVGTDERRRTIHLALVGDFSAEQRRVLELTRVYMERFFGVPTKVARTIPGPGTGSLLDFAALWVIWFSFRRER